MLLKTSWIKTYSTTCSRRRVSRMSQVIEKKTQVALCIIFRPFLFLENEEIDEKGLGGEKRWTRIQKKKKKWRALQFNLHLLWCFPLDPHLGMNHCGASWPECFCFSPPYCPSLAALVTALGTGGGNRGCWICDYDLGNPTLKEFVLIPADGTNWSSALPPLLLWLAVTVSRCSSSVTILCLALSKTDLMTIESS